MSRLPLRLRLALAFALAMAVVLAAVGALLYVRLGDSLQEQLDDTLGARADAIVALGPDLDAADLASGDDEGYARLLGEDGILFLGSIFETRTPYTLEDLLRARDGQILQTRKGMRVLLRPVERDGQQLVLVVGASLEDRDEALAGLLAQLLVVGPLALLLSSLAGYLLAGAALRSVEAMRRRADEVSTDEPGRRLPLPRARDEMRRLGETLNAMLQRLEDGLARERRFVADASHELRTPLALLQTELELARRRPRSPEELEGALRSAAEEVDRLVRLAEDLLVLARADEGRLALRRAPVSSADLLAAVARRFAARAEAEGRALEVGDGGGLVDGDRMRLEQALGNLVDNALRHGAGTVRLESSRADGLVELRVRDEGAGFPPEFLPRAFDRFTRTDEARGGGAAGLGLAIVDAVARAHGGEASAANRDGAGAVVSLTLPAAAVQADPPERGA